MTPLFFSPELWLSIGAHVAKAPAQELWDVMGTRPAQPAVSNTPVAESHEDAMAVSDKLKSA